MIFSTTDIDGAKVVDIDRIEDDRGFFARCWCPAEFAESGVPMHLAQASVAFTRRRGTVRGMHYQKAPHQEDKLVRCTRGTAYVVIADLRDCSPTYLSWFGVELTADNHRMLYVPKGCAQGYQTLAKDTEVFYQMSQFYEPTAKGGIRFNDPALKIQWPLDVTCISEADLAWPDYQEDLVRTS